MISFPNLEPAVQAALRLRMIQALRRGHLPKVELLERPVEFGSGIRRWVVTVDTYSADFVNLNLAAEYLAELLRGTSPSAASIDVEALKAGRVLRVGEAGR